MILCLNNLQLTLLSLAWFLLTSCSVGTAVSSTRTAVSPSPTATASTTPVVIDHNPTQIVTPAPVCTPPACQANEVYFCPDDCPGGCGTTCATVTPGPNLDTAVPTTWNDLIPWLQANYIAQANPAAVQAALQSAGWQASVSDLRAADLNGDGRDEWILLLYPPEQTEKIAPANLWVVNENGRTYQFYDEPNLNAGFSLQLGIAAITDITGDSVPELFINEESCGAHTCFSGYHIMHYEAGRLQNIVHLPDDSGASEMQAISVSYADTQFSDATGDNTLDFLVHGGSIGSVGAGIVRTYTEVWAWNGTAVTLVDTLLDPTTYRHHILYEANQRFAEANLAQATQLYEQAINDDALITPEFMSTEAETYADITQFAAFRLILIDLLQGNPEQANGRFTWLQENYANTAITQAAQTLIINWNGRDALPALCSQITVQLESAGNPTGSLTDLGYGNPSLGAADVCPVD